MLTLKQLKSCLEQLLPENGVIDYCPNGLQVEGKEKIQKIGTAVSASLAVIEKAALLGLDALIVHHGIFWHKDPYPITGVKKKKLALLLEAGISLFAYHLPLDMHPVLGNNWRAAREMGWMELEPFYRVNGICLGVKGRIQPSSVEIFQQSLESYYAHPAMIAAGGPREIKKVALVSGGAHKVIEDAIIEGMDAFVTGSFDEPIWHRAFEENIHFFALGHADTEKVGPKALGLYLEQLLSLPCTFIDLHNPF